MSIWQIVLTDLGRIGMGLAYAMTALVDIKSRRQIFQLMKVKNVPTPWVFYVGAITWKIAMGLLLVVNFYTVAAALLLALYIFLANFVFNNFWSLAKEQREFSFYLFMVHLASCFGLLVIAGIN